MKHEVHVAKRKQNWFVFLVANICHALLLRDGSCAFWDKNCLSKCFLVCLSASYHVKVIHVSPNSSTSPWRSMQLHCIVLIPGDAMNTASRMESTGELPSYKLRMRHRIVDTGMGHSRIPNHLRIQIWSNHLPFWKHQFTDLNPPQMGPGIHLGDGWSRVLWAWLGDRHQMVSASRGLLHMYARRCKRPHSCLWEYL